MSKYMFLFRGGMMAEMSPEQLQTNMMRWKNWMEELAAKGRMVGGEPLADAGKVLRGKDKKISDGPFAEGKELVGGYLIVNASSMDEAVELSKGCPIFEREQGSLEVRQVMEAAM